IFHSSGPPLKKGKTQVKHSNSNLAPGSNRTLSYSVENYTHEASFDGYLTEPAEEPLRRHGSVSSSIKKVLPTGTAAKKGLVVIGGIAVVTGLVFLGDMSASRRRGFCIERKT